MELPSSVPSAWEAPVRPLLCSSPELPADPTPRRVSHRSRRSQPYTALTPQENSARMCFHPVAITSEQLLKAALP